MKIIKPLLSSKRSWLSLNMIKGTLVRSVFALVFCLLNAISSFSQGFKMQQVTPKSPNIASLEKFTEIPVGLGTGKLNFSIPLYEIIVGELKIPITLNYNNDGLKCDEIPSWVGLGWDLTTGGYLSYQQNGLNDFDPAKGMFPNGKYALDRYFANLMGAQEKQFFFEDIIARELDAEYDQYFYNFPGHNGSFHFTDLQTARTNPKTDLKVSKTALGFKIIDESGNTFFFESKELISTVNSLDVSPDFSDASSFYITKIITSDNQLITYKYKAYSLQYSRSTAYADLATVTNCGQPSNISYNETITNINYLLPDEIGFPLGSVKFTHSQTIREDLKSINPSTNVPHLASITIYNKIEKIKEYTFDMGYFGSNTRLKLNSLNEKGAGQQEKKWNLSYYAPPSISFPPYFSDSKDHWGYFNGASNYNSLPKANYSVLMPTVYGGVFNPMADRSSNFNFSQIGMLKSVQYPTGGTSEFQYEQNQFSMASYSDFQFNPWMLRANDNSYTVPLLGGGASVTTDIAVAGSFTVPAGGNFYKLDSWRILSPDPLWSDPQIIFSGPNLSANLLNSKVNLCNFSINQCTYSDVVFLEAGTYTFSVTGSYYMTSEWTPYYLYAGFMLNSKEENDVKPYPLGGGRISKIITKADPLAVPMLKKYIYNDSLSHVNIKNIPSYITTRPENTTITGGFSGITNCLPCQTRYVVSEKSIIPMVGANIEYGMVTEYNDENGVLGKVDNYLSFSENFIGTLSPPFVASINTSWRSGIPIRKKIFMNGIASPKQENNLSYSADFTGTQINGLKVMYDQYCENSASRTYLTNLATLISEDYKLINQSQKITESSGTINNTSNFLYNSQVHQQPKIISATLSDGNVGLKTIKYVFDYNNLSLANQSESLGLKLLKDANMNMPIEELSVKKINGIDYIIGGTLTVYKPGQTVREAVYALKVTDPIPLFAFTNSSINSYGSLVKDARYELRIVFDRYDPTNNNLLEQHMQDGTKTCYLYSYSNQYPIAEIKNVSYVTIESMLGGNSAINSFSSLSNPDKAAIDGFIQTLRSNLPMSHITSYTYKPLVGMTSQTDPKGMTTYFEYDSFQRLKHIKDQNGNIVKSYCYNYAGQVSDCNVGGNTGNSANWVNTGMNSECETQPDPFFNNQPAVTGNMLIEQVDNNPNSPTYNTTRKITDPTAQPGSCPPNYYYTTETDPYLSSVTFNAKRSYDDGTTKTMRFRVRHDSIYYPWGITEEYVDIQISSSGGGTGYNFIMVNAASYLEVELMEVF